MNQKIRVLAKTQNSIKCIFLNAEYRHGFKKEFSLNISRFMDKQCCKNSPIFWFRKQDNVKYSETLNNKYIERIHQMSYSPVSDNGMLQIFSFLIK